LIVLQAIHNFQWSTGALLHMKRLLQALSNWQTASASQSTAHWSKAGTAACFEGL